METAVYRGDILFLNNADDPIEVGEIVVFKLAGRDIPIVHRVLKVHEKCVAQARRAWPWRHGASVPPPPYPRDARRPDGSVDLLTKGDNNSVDDRGLYTPGQLWLSRGDVLGRARACVRACMRACASAWACALARAHVPVPELTHALCARAASVLPYVGMVTIYLNDYPAVKFILVGVMALFVLTSKDS